MQVRVRDDVRTVESYVEAIGTATVAVASRYHATLAAVVGNTPVAAVAYEPKIRSLMAELERPDQCFDAYAFDTPGPAAAISDLVRNPPNEPVPNQPRKYSKPHSRRSSVSTERSAYSSRLDDSGLMPIQKMWSTSGISNF